MVHDLSQLFALLVLGLVILAIPLVILIVFAKMASPSRSGELPSILEPKKQTEEPKSEKANEH